MDARSLSIFFLLLTPVVIEPWQTLDARPSQEMRRHLHYHSKRHMLPRDSGRKKHITTQRSKEFRKKPSGYLKPLQEDDMENDEIVSVAIGPPAIRPIYDKMVKNPHKIINRTTNSYETAAANLVKDVLVQIGREFLTRQVNEDFVFGQYVGNSMRNLTNDLRLKMQHEILDIIVKYQKITSEKDVNVVQTTTANSPEEKFSVVVLKDPQTEKKTANDTEDAWPDFTNLAKIVG
ncbi:uncharacterized protein LOC124529775 [Vanessa cardui]|uniref:uncharacterized protein LOC124529775 n=1 Tax=Vanessa cardui TaxID=171605 RepID=UPI001F12F44C|nr:uncharacterized protein LOC124529775 [Vanessa cardui]